MPDKRKRYEAINEVAVKLSTGRMTMEEAERQLSVALRPVPTVRPETRRLFGVQIALDIIGLREQIVARLAARPEVLGEQIEEALTKVVNEFDVEAEVQKHARPALEKAIKSAIEHACSKLVYDGEFNSVVFDRVVALLATDERRT